jgi:hypothetical protein
MGDIIRNQEQWQQSGIKSRRSEQEQAVFLPAPDGCLLPLFGASSIG